jgi:arylsulfatase
MKAKIASLLLFLFVFATAGIAHGQSKPNIVLILMDNLGYGELGVYGGGILRGAPTPRLDKLASEGTRLLNFNVEAQCTLEESISA